MKTPKAFLIKYVFSREESRGTCVREFEGNGSFVVSQSDNSLIYVSSPTLRHGRLYDTFGVAEVCPKTSLMRNGRS